MTNLFSQGHALLVGVGGDLPNTITDAEEMAAILTDSERYAYPPKQVNVLAGEAAGRTAILQELDGLAAVGSESTVVVYFSGHGYQVESPLGLLYFLMPYGYNTAALAQAAIRGDELASKLAAIPAQKILLLFDCCRAGGVSEVKTSDWHCPKHRRHQNRWPFSPRGEVAC